MERRRTPLHGALTTTPTSMRAASIRSSNARLRGGTCARPAKAASAAKIIAKKVRVAHPCVRKTQARKHCEQPASARGPRTTTSPAARYVGGNFCRRATCALINCGTPPSIDAPVQNSKSGAITHSLHGLPVLFRSIRRLNTARHQFGSDLPYRHASSRLTMHQDAYRHLQST
jgi:hypothetical protein